MHNIQMKELNNRSQYQYFFMKTSADPSGTNLTSKAVAHCRNTQRAQGFLDGTSLTGTRNTIIMRLSCSGLGACTQQAEDLSTHHVEGTVSFHRLYASPRNPQGFSVSRWCESQSGVDVFLQGSVASQHVTHSQTYEVG